MQSVHRNRKYPGLRQGLNLLCPRSLGGGQIRCQFRFTLWIKGLMNWFLWNRWKLSWSIHLDLKTWERLCSTQSGTRTTCLCLCGCFSMQTVLTLWSCCRPWTNVANIGSLSIVFSSRLNVACCSYEEIITHVLMPEDSKGRHRFVEWKNLASY